jgi:hypothetical protein
MFLSTVVVVYMIDVTSFYCSLMVLTYCSSVSAQRQQHAHTLLLLLLYAFMLTAKHASVRAFTRPEQGVFLALY